ncbi:hypothetical protein PFNF135_05499, partial [Plasmodium falciparum NF135/5.C10]
MMYYTFGDYRDFLFGTDISRKNGDMTKIKNNIDNAFKEKKDNVRKDNNANETFWEENKKLIWEGMLCGLTYDLTENEKKKILEDTKYQYDTLTPPLEDFAKKPQFLRWMIEWGEEFCAERKKKEEDVETYCTHVNDHDGCNNKAGKCSKACEAYEDYIKKKNKEYTKQEEKFNTDKSNDKEEYNGYSKKKASEYLKDKCFPDRCNCIEKVNSITDYWKNPHETYENSTIKNKCECPKPLPSACSIVETLFTTSDKKHINAACTQKYSGNQSRLGWKCIPTSGGEKSGSSDSNQGSICIPPRRRKLYLGGFDKFISGEATLSSPSHSRDVDLRNAFIQSAAVETFFLWDRYKKQKEKPQGEGALGLETLNGGSGDGGEQTPEQQLQSGTIPTDFLRLMFYTLGDYRDLCVGVKDNDVIKALEASSDKNIEKIEQKIKSVIENSGDTTPPTQTVPPTSDEKRKKWWDENAKDIWEGMICALTYDTNSGGKTIEKVNAANGGEDLFEKLKNGNDYETVSFGASGTGAKGNDDPKLTEFVTRPTFFRWLEEWGEEFCKERKKRLELVKKACREKDDGGDTFCSGDGHDCTDGKRRYNNMFDDLDCSDCHEKCTDYKKWIEKKLEEFYKQKSKYPNEYEKLKTSSNSHDDEMFYKEVIEKNDYSSVEKFLESLNHCKNRKDNSEQNNKIDFNEPLKTFSPSTYCKSCPLYGVSCDNKGECKPIEEHEFKRKNDLDEIKIKKDTSTNIHVQMIDHRGQYIQHPLGNSFKESYLFKSVRDQEWTCRFIHNKLDECKLNDFNPKIDTDESITFKVLLERWLKDFLEGYYISKRKIETCTKKEENKCIKGCKNKCKCVDDWLKQKENEWENIKERYKAYYDSPGYEMAYKVRSYFEKHESDVKKSIDDYEVLKNKDEYEDCNGQNNCTSVDKKRKKDMVTLLLNNLQNEINKCPSSTSVKTSPPCVEPPPGDEEENVEDTTTNTKPQFCPKDVEEDKKEPPTIADDKTGYKRTGGKSNLPTKPSNCVQIGAYEIQQKINKETKEIKSKVIGNGLLLDKVCKRVNKNDISNETCDFNKRYSKFPTTLTNKCNKKGKDRFKIGNLWTCQYIRILKNDVCIPPRRKEMCIDEFSNIGGYKVSDSNELLKKVQEAARNEADDIIRKLLQSNPCNEDLICDALKYSFADLGDIIRGRDLLINNTTNDRVERRLRTIFSKIYNTLGNNAKMKYNDITYYYKLREAWWDTNRKDIWKAMTCAVPEDAKFFKKQPRTQNGPYKYCGHDKDPPYDDNIPQLFRWMTEWSEYFCKVLDKQMEMVKRECDDCKKNKGTKCNNDEDGDKCKKCKKQCKEYASLVTKWEKQFVNQQKIYNEFYKEATIKYSRPETVLFKNRKHTTTTENTKENIIEFIKAIDTLCSYPKSLNDYLHKKSKCENFKFLEQYKTEPEYIFSKNPNDYDKACKCTGPHPLDDCPKNDKNKNPCTNLSIIKECEKKFFNKDNDDWNSQNIPEFTSKNKGILVPPRRRHLCLRNITANISSIQNEDDFKNKLIESAYNEGYFLGKTYAKDKQIILQAMRYSFYDYGDIVKGTDVMDNLKKLHEILKSILKTENGNNQISHDRKNWWTQNKTHVWHAMLCGYEATQGNFLESDCLLHDDENDQFLRWFQEWIEHFCTKRNQLYQNLENQCKHLECNKNDEGTGMTTCKRACQEYSNYISTKKHEYELLNYQYEKNFMINLQNKKAPEYYKDKCNNKCNCFSEYFKDETRWKNPYESFNESTYKDKCDCQKTVPPPLVPPPPPPKSDELPAPADEPFDSTILQTTIPFGVALALGSIAFLFLK